MIILPTALNWPFEAYHDLVTKSRQLRIHLFILKPKN